MEHSIKLAIALYLAGVWWCYAQKIDTFEPLYQTQTVYSTSLDNLIITTGIWDPLRSGANYVIQYISGTRYSGQIDNFENASQITLTFVSGVINRFLGLLSLIALIYLIYHAFMVVIWSSTQTKINDHRKAIYTALIVIIWIWLSWMIVSAMFYLVTVITS